MTTDWSALLTHSHGHSHSHGHARSHGHAHAAHTHPVQTARPGSGARAPLRVQGVLLPEGERTQLWLRDGRVTFEPQPGAITIAADGWILPGLVDAHCHVGLNHAGAVGADEAEEQAITDRDAGVLLIRDAGSPSDTRWMDEREDLPKIVRAGRHIARPKRYLRGFAEEVEPGELVAEIRRQAIRSDGWVKLVGDWIDRDLGDLAPLWPADLARAAIDAAHECGARVTAHCFGEQSVAELVAAGIDGVEHGTGIDDDVIAQMAERQVALVPTMINLESFPAIAAAGEAKFPQYAAHMRALHARRLDTLGKALDAGVPIHAGTDAGGALAHGLIVDEVTRLAALGGAEFALGAASWRARRWLGQPCLEEGAQADLLVLDDDPRVDIETLRRPKWIVLRGVARPGPR